jgi:hypothetical protein
MDKAYEDERYTAFEKEALDKETIDNYDFKHPTYNRPGGGSYAMDIQKLVEGNQSYVNPPVIDADWDLDMSNTIVKRAWEKYLPMKVNLYIDFKLGNWDKSIEMAVIIADVNRDTNEFTWNTTHPISFSLINDADKKKQIYNGFNFRYPDPLIDPTVDLRKLHLYVRVPSGDHALRVIFNQIDTKQQRRYGRIALTTFAANCKYNTLEVERVLINLVLFPVVEDSLLTARGIESMINYGTSLPIGG